MKEGLIKITDTENLYYDSITKQYKFGMHCPYCGKHSGCWCFPDFECIPLFEEEFPNTYCSDRHFVLGESDSVEDIASEMGITIKLTMEEWNASKIVKALMETDYDGDCPSGETCTI